MFLFWFTSSLMAILHCGAGVTAVSRQRYWSMLVFHRAVNLLPGILAEIVAEQTFIEASCFSKLDCIPSLVLYTATFSIVEAQVQ